MDEPSFNWIGPVVPMTPVVIAVPHAGRYYPAELGAAARVSIARLAALEDRHVDLLLDGVLATGATAIVANVARAWIDLNRHPDEVDPTMIDPQPRAGTMREGPRTRAGLGLVPRRVSGVGEILKERIAASDLSSRIAEVHRPYHVAIADLLAATRAAHGVAVLLDLHSMPPLAGSERGVQVVVGDLNGASAAMTVTMAAMDAAQAAGYRVTRNRPYAGGYSVAEHGRPRHGVHAVQLEICRTCYLDRTMLSAGTGLESARRLIESVHGALAAAVERADMIRVEAAE